MTGAISEPATFAGCSLCETNRITLEKAWQVVANEFYDAHGKFSQDAWARALLQTLKVWLVAGSPVWTRCRHTSRSSVKPEFVVDAGLRRRHSQQAPAECCA